MLAILDDTNFRVLTRELEFVQEITLKNKKEKITTFCLNMGVYRASTSGVLQSQTDQICVATNEKMLYFFETIMSSVGIQFQQDQKYERGYQIPHKAIALVWDDEKIYMANTKGYYIINKDNGAPVARVEFDKAALPRIGAILSKDDPLPMMAVYKDRCLVVTRKN